MRGSCASGRPTGKSTTARRHRRDNNNDSNVNHTSKSSDVNNIYEYHEDDDDDATIKSLKVALRSNRELQTTILRELEKISLRKTSNRIKVADQFKQLRQQHQAAAAITTDHDARHCCSSNNNNNNKKRKWTSTFFFDENDGSIPKPNPDTIRRQKLEQSTFFCNTQPPWSKKESQILQDVIKEIYFNEKDQNNTSKIDKSKTKHKQQQEEESIDYEIIAQKFNEKHQQIGKKSKKKKKVTTTSNAVAATSIPKRTSTECQIQHAELIRQSNRVPFSKEECKQILELVNKNRNRVVDWESIANTISSSSNNNKTPRTAWECFILYQTKLEKTSNVQWTSKQDELLFKYIAACGPCCFVGDLSAIRNIMIRQNLDIPTTANASRVYTRIHQSLLNPNMKHDTWKDDEERSLAIYMKIYRDCRNSNSNNNSSSSTKTSNNDGGNAPGINPISMASRHLPRAPKSVADKWSRSLNPAFSSKPFTKQEDAQLLKTMEQYNFNEIGWTELSTKHFPHRHPQRLASRFAEVASDKQILLQAGL